MKDERLEEKNRKKNYIQYLFFKSYNRFEGFSFNFRLARVRNFMLHYMTT
jgi:hypothetical protein